MHISRGGVQGPGPVHGPWAREKPIFGAPGICQSSPRCPRVSPQRVVSTDSDLPEMDYYVPWALEAPQYIIVHLGEVRIGKNGPPWRHHGASGGALTFFGKLQMSAAPWNIMNPHGLGPGPGPSQCVRYSAESVRTPIDRFAFFGKHANIERGRIYIYIYISFFC